MMIKDDDKAVFIFLRGVYRRAFYREHEGSSPSLSRLDEFLLIFTSGIIARTVMDEITIKQVKHLGESLQSIAIAAV